MQHRRKKHALRNVFLSVILLIVLGGAAYGMTKYRSVKNSVNNSFTPSGVTKERNVSGQLKNNKIDAWQLFDTDRTYHCKRRFNNDWEIK